MALVNVLDNSQDDASNGIGGLGGHAAQVQEPGGIPPWQAEAVPYKWSLERDIQFRELYGAAQSAMLGVGVLTGCAVEKSGALTVTVLKDRTRFHCAGVVWRLVEDAIFNTINYEGQTVLWACLKQTLADPLSPAFLATYEMDLVASDSKPSPVHFPLAVIQATAGDITDVDDNPSEKWAAKRVVEVYTTLGVGASDEVTVDHSDYFVRWHVGHTRVREVDQDGVTATVLLDSVSEESFTLALESAGSPSVDYYGGETDLRVTVELWGAFFDL